MKNGTMIEGERNIGDTLHYRERVRGLAAQLAFLEVLGKGAHGAAVLVATEADPGTTFVVKMLRHERLASAQAVARFRRELTVHQRLSHTFQVPRVVRCLDHHDDRDPARIYGVFPYYRHGTLADVMAAGATIDTGLSILVDAVEGLQALHGHGYVHRDVCPANIFVDDEAGRPRGYIGDLGVGLFLEANTLITEDELLAESQLHVGHVGFTDPSFAATEQGDLHGVGATLYWLVTGHSTVPAPDAEGLMLPPRRTCRPGIGVEFYDRAARVLGRLTCTAGTQRYGCATEARVGISELVAAPIRQHPRQPDHQIAPGRDRARRPTPPTLAAFPTLRIATLVSSAAAIGIVIVTAGLWTLRSIAPTPELALEGSARIALSQPVESLVTGETSSRGARSMPAGVNRGPTEDIVRLLALAVSAPLGTDVATMERQLWQTVESDPGRGELRLALARVLASRGRGQDATGVLAAAPLGTTYGEEIRQLHELLGSGGRP